MYSEALVTIVGGTDRTVTVSSPGFPGYHGDAFVNISTVVMYDIVPQHQGGFIVFVTDDWVLTNGMCLTVGYTFIPHHKMGRKSTKTKPAVTILFIYLIIYLFI